MSPMITSGKAIAVLRSAIVNSRIYPKGSQMIETSIQGAHQALETCLRDAPQLIVSDLQGKLCIDGKEAPEARDFITFLRQHDVQSIKFLQGVTPAEIAILAEGLGRHRGKSDKNLDAWLKDQGTPHLMVEEIQFVARQKGDVVVQQALGLLQGTAGDTAAMISVLEETLHRADKTLNPEEKSNAQRQISRHLSGLPPHQLREFLESRLPDPIEKSGLKEQVIQTLTQEQLEETLEEVHKWFEKIKKESRSELEVVEKLTGLKNFLSKILQGPASRKVTFALYEELLNEGLLDDIPADVKEGADSSLLAQTEHLLSQPSEAMLDPAVRQNFPDLVKGLCALGHEDRIQKLADKVLENLQSNVPLVRETTVKILRAFEEILAANRKEAIFSTIVKALHRLADTESAPNVYSEAVLGLQDAAMELLVSWRFEDCAAILATLRRHSQEESPVSHKRREVAAKALQVFSGRGLEVVCSDLNAPSQDRQKGAYRVLAEMGEAAVEPLVEALEQSNDPRSRQSIIQALKRLGPPVKGPLLEKLHVNQSGEILIKLIPLVEDFADASSLPMLSGLLQHPDAAVRRQMLQLLARVEPLRNQALFIALLDDADTDIQEEAIRALGRLRLAGTVSELAKRLSSAAPSVQEKICIALGALGDRSAVPALINLVHGQRPAWKRLWQQPDHGRDAARVRAVGALGQFLPDREAEKALLKAQNDPVPMIRRVAQTALKSRPSPPKQTLN